MCTDIRRIGGHVSKVPMAGLDVKPSARLLSPSRGHHHHAGSDLIPRRDTLVPRFVFRPTDLLVS
jgi:hypothetical protein